jgi:hypothetical protein
MPRARAASRASRDIVANHGDRTSIRIHILVNPGLMTALDCEYVFTSTRMTRLICKRRISAGQYGSSVPAWYRLLVNTMPAD